MHENTRRILLEDPHKRLVHGHRDILDFTNRTDCFSIIGYSANAIFIPKSVLKGIHDIWELLLLTI